MEAILIFTAFVIKHFIADFVLQYDYMVREKGQWMKPGGLHHSGIHALGTLAIAAGFGVGLTLVLLAVIIDAVTHYVIDWSKSQATQSLTPLDRSFWIWVGFDQMLHYMVYVLITWMVLL